MSGLIAPACRQVSYAVEQMFGEISGIQNSFFPAMWKVQNMKDEVTDLAGVMSSAVSVQFVDGRKPCCCICFAEPTVGHEDKKYEDKK